MGIVAIILSFILYIIIGVSSIYKKDYPHALIWFAYSIRQIGFLWHMIISEQK